MRVDDLYYNREQKPTRRRILRTFSGVLATGFAGCLGGDRGADTTTETPTETSQSDLNSANTPAHRWIDDPFSEYHAPEERNSAGFEVTGQATLDPGFFTEIELPLTLPSQVSVSVSTEGANMDVYLLTRQKFNQYREREDIQFSNTLAVTNTNRVGESYQAEPGNYSLVFDNSPVYGSQPEGPVHFEFQLSTTATNPLIENSGPPEIVRSSDQPKIVEIRDNLGHTFVESDGGLVPYPVEDEFTLTDDTVVTLRVTKIAAESGDDVSYAYDFLERGHRYNTPGYIPVSSWAWDLRRDDYQDSIAFRISITNSDAIEHSAPSGDDSVDVRYSNLTLGE